MIDRLRAAVIGCGTAGAAASLFLSRAEHDVTVFERVPDPQPVGAGIMMQPSGLAVLTRLGCAARITARGARVDRLRCENERGDAVLDLAYTSLGSELCGFGLHRGVLFETLFGAVRAARVDLRCGIGIDRVGPHARSGRMLTDERGDRHGPFDLVVVCDGARSKVRDAMPHLAKRVTPYPWGALWFIGQDDDERYAHVLFQKVRGTGQMAGMLPTGLGPGNGNRRHVSLFHSVRADAVDAWKRGGIVAWRDHIRSFAPEAEPIANQVDDMEQLTFASYYDVSMPRWHFSGVVFLGDAAHATSPQLGQGSNLALCDAMALADALERARNVDEGLAHYTAERRAHLSYYQFATRLLTPFFQSNYEVLALVRDALMAKGSKIAYVEREMVRSMCGTKTGLL